jgi:hypothetical protein
MLFLCLYPEDYPTVSSCGVEGPPTLPRKPRAARHPIDVSFGACRGTDYVGNYFAAIASSPSTWRRNSAAASGSTTLINIPEPSSNPATRVSRGMMLTYQ